MVPWILRRKDEQKSGRPSLISEDLLQEIEGEIRANRRVTITKLRHIIPEASKTTIHKAVTKKLGYRKLCERWTPKILWTITKRNEWVPRWSFSHATHRKEMSFWNPFWMEMKTWGFHHTPESKQQSLQCRHTHDVVQRAGGRLLWLRDKEAGSKT